MTILTIERKPPWLRVAAFHGQGFEHVSRRLSEHRLNTVCQAANCPNRGECFNHGTATFLIMGPNCTRNCRFCDIRAGKPLPLDSTEPVRLAQMATELKLKHVVVTSVTRDDLPDGGADHFAATVRELRRALPTATVELLTPDFRRSSTGPDIIIAAAPDVFNHNVETVPRLYRSVRPGADYQRSLDLLRHVRDHSNIPTKSGLMVGLGETTDELRAVFSDLAAVGILMLTIGQYLSPSRDHLPVIRYVHPDEFELLGRLARNAGIKRVMSGPLVRSSYRAEAL